MLSTVRLGDFALRTRGLRRLSKLTPGFVALTVPKNARPRVLVAASARRSHGATIGPLTNERAICEVLLQSYRVVACDPEPAVVISPLKRSARIATSDPFSVDPSGVLELPRAYRAVSSPTSVVVGVLSTGVDSTHPDLVNQMWRNVGEVAGNGIDDDQNGYIDDVHGWNSSSVGLGADAHNGDTSDSNGLGTKVAGIIAAQHDNSIGLEGVNPHARIMALRWLSSTVDGTLVGWGSGAIGAIEYAVSQKQAGVNLRVISQSAMLSFGLSSTAAVNEAVAQAKDAGIVFVVPAGDSRANLDLEPRAERGLADLVVAESQDNGLASWTRENGSLGYHSSYGPRTVHLAAPGNWLGTTAPGGTYDYQNGSQAAAAIVAGAASLLVAHEPSLSRAEVIDRILGTGGFQVNLIGLLASPRILNVANLVEGVYPPDLLDNPVSYTVSPKTFVPRDLRGEGGAARVLPVANSTQSGVMVPVPFATRFYNLTVPAGGFVTVYGNGYIGFSVTDDANLDPQRHYPLAPARTIAALRAYFAPDPSWWYPWELPADQGVWVKSSPAEMVIQWHLAPRAYPELGVVSVLLVLYPDGTIAQSVSVPNDDLARYLTTNGFIGTRERTLANSKTLSYLGVPMAIAGDFAFEYRRTDGSSVTPSPTPSPVATATSTPTSPAPTATPVPTATALPPTPTPVPTPSTTPTLVPPVNVTPTAVPPTPTLGALRIGSSRGRGQLASERRFWIENVAGIPGRVQVAVVLNQRMCGQTRLVFRDATPLRGDWPRLGTDFQRLRLMTGAGVVTAALSGLKRGPAITSSGGACDAVLTALRRMRP